MSNETHDAIMTATRARKALANLSKLIKARRKEIQEVKNAAKESA
jgi:hypothetical protein